MRERHAIEEPRARHEVYGVALQPGTRAHVRQNRRRPDERCYSGQRAEIESPSSGEHTR